MIEPTLALQTAIRSALIAAPAVTALVPADHIRAGWVDTGNLPSIIMASGQTVYLGNGSGSQYIARVFLDLHIWAVEDGADTAKAIGFAACDVLKDAPASPDMGIDEWRLPAVRWMRDPEPEKAFTHGVLTVEAVIRWSV